MHFFMRFQFITLDVNVTWTVSFSDYDIWSHASFVFRSLILVFRVLKAWYRNVMFSLCLVFLNNFRKILNLVMTLFSGDELFSFVLENFQCILKRILTEVIITFYVLLQLPWQLHSSSLWSFSWFSSSTSARRETTKLRKPKDRKMQTILTRLLCFVRLVYQIFQNVRNGLCSHGNVQYLGMLLWICK